MLGAKSAQYEGHWHIYGGEIFCWKIYNTLFHEIGTSNYQHLVLQKSKVLKRRGRDSSVGNGTHYWQDDLGIQSQWVQDCLLPSRWGGGSPPAFCIMSFGSISWVVKWPGSVTDHPSPSSAKDKERVELFLYFSSALGWTLTLLKKGK